MKIVKSMATFVARMKPNTKLSETISVKLVRPSPILKALFLLLFAAVPVKAKDCGKASFYHEGRRTANGERFHPDGLTAAHRSLPFGSIVHVSNGRRTVRVRINDRGPAAWTGRVIDLSRGAARQLGMIPAGVCRVCFTTQGHTHASASPSK